MRWCNGIVFAILLASALACGSAPPRLPMRAPNPNGCSVTIFAQPGIAPAPDVWNGPGKWPSLETLRETNHSSWTNRIRSLRVGPAATVTAFTQPKFAGQSEQYPAGAAHPMLTPPFSTTIQSLEIACNASPTQ